MNTKILTTAVLLATTSLMICVPLKAKDPPAQTHQPGPWQPAARVNLKQPVEINLINKTSVTLEYDLTGHEEDKPQELLPGDAPTEITQLPIPAYILINPKSSNPESSSFNLQFNVTAVDNEVTVEIYEINSNISGHSTFNLHETGAIYVY